MSHQQDDFAVILPAAGRSARFGGARGKLLEDLAGEPVVRRSARAFLRRDDVRCVIVATASQPPDALSTALGECADDPRLRFCLGGSNRAESVRNALAHVPAELHWIAVHDAARPLVSQDLIARVFGAARRYGAAVPALAVALTIKEAQGPLPAKVQRTIPRHTLWAMQTPQCMRRQALEDAYARCPLPLDEVTDDVQLLELAGHDVWLVAGEEENLKITTRADLRVAALLLDDDPDAAARRS